MPGLMDLSSEPEHIHKMYGTKLGESTFAGNCLLARRMVERGCGLFRYVTATGTSMLMLFMALRRLASKPIKLLPRLFKISSSAVFLIALS